MSEMFRLLEGLELEKLSAGRAIQEIQRIADKTLSDMASVYYVERLEAIAELARIAAARIENQTGSSSRGIMP